MSELAEALGVGRDLTLDGKTLHLDPLDFADLADLEEAMELEPRSAAEEEVIAALHATGKAGAENYSNPLSRLRPMKIAHQLIILHLCLRKSQPKLTRGEAAGMISARQFQKPETSEFLSTMLVISGIMTEPEPGTEPDDSSKAESETDPKKSRTRRASTSV